jgi:hypothetical protein
MLSSFDDFVDKSLKILGSCGSVDEVSGLLGIKLC